jgi:hypothetical protein
VLQMVSLKKEKYKLPDLTETESEHKLSGERYYDRNDVARKRS